MSDLSAASQGPAYRAYLLNWNGRVASAEPIEADSDDEARLWAGKIANGRGIELWDGVRHVADFPKLSAGEAPLN